jgi:hypothetical protein
MFWREVSSPNGFALTMIAILGLGLGTAFMVILTVIRHSGRTETEVDELIEEAHREVHGSGGENAQEEAVPEPASSSAPVAQPWEKEADWWKAKKS